MFTMLSLPVSAGGGIPVRAMQSEDFYVAVMQDVGAIRLDIVRHDLRDGITWDELQQVKRDCGFGEQDAIEFYPADKDVCNTGNVRHLYVFDARLPLIRRAA